MESKHSRFWPLLILFFLAPAIGELLSGSAPPAEFFNPPTLLLLGALYGSGAILIRELRVRWDKGWLTVFALGAVYGIVEEGLMVKSFFDPNWMDLGILGEYGRWAGVNWVWSLELTVYHAVFSIAIPIALVEMLFPKLRKVPWLKRKGMIGFSSMLVAVVALGYFALTPYRPPVILYAVAVIAASALVIIARRLPEKIPAMQKGLEKAMPRPRWFALLGFGATLAFFFINWGWSSLGVPVLFTLLGTILLAFLVTHQVRKMSRGDAWTDEHRLALMGGAVGFFILLAPLSEMDSARKDNTSGMTFVGLLALAFLILLWRRIRRSLGKTHLVPPEGPQWDG